MARSLNKLYVGVVSEEFVPLEQSLLCCRARRWPWRQRNHFVRWKDHSWQNTYRKVCTDKPVFPRSRRRLQFGCAGLNGSACSMLGKSSLKLHFPVFYLLVSEDLWYRHDAWSNNSDASVPTQTFCCLAWLLIVCRKLSTPGILWTNLNDIYCVEKGNLICADRRTSQTLQRARIEIVMWALSHLKQGRY